MEATLESFEAEAATHRAAFDRAQAALIENPHYSIEGKAELSKKAAESRDAALTQIFNAANAHLETQITAVDRDLARERIAQAEASRTLLKDVGPASIEIAKTKLQRILAADAGSDDFQSRVEAERAKGAALVELLTSAPDAAEKELIASLAVALSDELPREFLAAIAGRNPTAQKLAELDRKRGELESARHEAHRRLNPNRENELQQRFKL